MHRSKSSYGSSSAVSFVIAGLIAALFAGTMLYYSVAGRPLEQAQLEEGDYVLKGVVDNTAIVVWEERIQYAVKNKPRNLPHHFRVSVRMNPSGGPRLPAIKEIQEIPMFPD